MSTHVVEHLKSRGLVDAITSDALMEAAKSPLRVYCGFDPTSDSLHLGNLQAIMGLAWFQRAGHTPVSIVGGATGMIGDPSGRQSERQLLDETTLRINERGIQKNIETVLLANPNLPIPLFLNNYDWYQTFTFLHFLRDVGKHFRVGIMLGKESVRARMESEEGMSFTEFSYQLLQGYDFYHLFKNYGVKVQIGGSDQWGNITAGIDYVRKVTGEQVFGLTMPLVTKGDGQKFGKSEKGAVWLSGDKLSPFEFYQYLFRTPDSDVINLLKRLTFLELGYIRELELSMKEPGYVPNSAQKVLAKAITEIVHGDEGVKKALDATEKMVPGKVAELDGQTINQLTNEVPSANLKPDDVYDQKLIDVVVKAGFLASKGDARRLIRNGGVWMNNKKIDDENFSISPQDLIEGRFLLISLGKKHKSIIEVRT